MTCRYGNHRDLDEVGQPCQAELTLSVTEFLRRWSDHMPLPGIHLLRAWGLYASTQRRKLAECREQVRGEERLPERPRVSAEEPPHDHPWEQCQACPQHMVVIQVLARGGAPPPQFAWAEAA